MATPPTPVAPLSSAKSATKASKPCKKVILHLSPHLLATFPSAQPVRKASRSKPAVVSQVDSPASSETHPNVEDAKLESEPTPAPEPSADADAAPRESTPNPLKRKGVPGPKPGTAKRSMQSLDANGLPKPRGKPGPKKRTKLDGESGPTASAAAAPHHKLGPKANQGAINAGLRALDRTSKPARNWLRKGFQLKSFTGVVWLSPSWGAPNGRRFGIEGEEKSGSNGSSEDLKAGIASSMPSEKSNSGGDTGIPGIVTDLVDVPISSPATQTVQPV